jgi:hypothetical protein
LLLSTSQELCSGQWKLIFHYFWAASQLELSLFLTTDTNIHTNLRIATKPNMCFMCNMCLYMCSYTWHTCLSG